MEGKEKDICGSRPIEKKIVDEIFGKLREVVIDVDAALGASHAKSSCASKVEQQHAPAVEHSWPPLPDEHSMPSPNKCLGPSLDEADTFDI